jgi:hypothetical protein
MICYRRYYSEHGGISPSLEKKDSHESASLFVASLAAATLMRSGMPKTREAWRTEFACT